ncbi:unnamed protein product, partial [Prorocentrum cordatum]
TQEFDFSALLDLERHLVLRELRGTRDRRERLFDVSPRQVHRSFAAAARSLAEVQRRGHWRSFHSAVRYDKHARVSLQLGELAAAKQAEVASPMGRGVAPFAARCARQLRNLNPRYGESS